jgi:hypothetical protein
MENNNPVVRQVASKVVIINENFDYDDDSEREIITAAEVFGRQHGRHF